MIKIIGKTLSNLLFPHICISCSDAIVEKNILCFKCMSKIAPVGLPWNEEHPSELRMQRRFNYQMAYSSFLMTKDNEIRKCLELVKYNYNKKAAYFLAELMAEDLMQFFPLHEIDIIIPVPLNKIKEEKRGYNQSELIGKIIAERTGKQFVNDLMIRTKNSASQTKKSRNERLENMKGIFELINPERFEGKHILLIDDVLTTGATLESCGIELLKINTARVSVATLTLAVYY